MKSKIYSIKCYRIFIKKFGYYSFLMLKIFFKKKIIFQNFIIKTRIFASAYFKTIIYTYSYNNHFCNIIKLKNCEFIYILLSIIISILDTYFLLF